MLTYFCHISVCIVIHVFWKNTGDIVCALLVAQRLVKYSRSRTQQCDVYGTSEGNGQLHAHTVFVITIMGASSFSQIGCAYKVHFCICFVRVPRIRHVQVHKHLLDGLYIFLYTCNLYCGASNVLLFIMFSWCNHFSL
jgi:hypothetical protein